uniref:RRM domain-containing protein n=1 Tax=Globodera rostochiensis TaxID=31243 RepID=A0A914HJ59_GLORO
MAEADEERMLLEEAGEIVDDDKMDAEMEEALLGSAMGVCNGAEKTSSMGHPNGEKGIGRNEQANTKKSMFGANSEQHLNQFKFNMYGAPSSGSIKFGGGMDLSLLSTNSSKSDTSVNGGALSNRADVKSKVKNPEKNSPVEKPATEPKKLMAERIANRIRKRRSQSVDSVLQSKWDISSSMLDISASDRSFDAPVPSKITRQSEGTGRRESNSSNSKKSETLAKFSFFSSTDRMMSEWAEKDRNVVDSGSEYDEEKAPSSGVSDDTEEGGSVDDQSDDGLGAEGENEVRFLGLISQKVTAKSKLYADERDNNKRLSLTSTTTSPSTFRERASQHNEFSAKTTLFVCPVPSNLDENGLKRYFLRFGQIRCVIVARNPVSGEHRGFGFVSFCSERAAVAAYAEKGQIWPRGGVKPFNLTCDNCTESALMTHFGRYGSIDCVQIGRTASDGRMALIQFANWRNASLAVAVNSKHCKWAATRGESPAKNGSPSKKLDNIFDMSKSDYRSSTAADQSFFSPSTRRSMGDRPNVRKQFFPDNFQPERRSRSVGRSVSNVNVSPYYTPAKKNLIGHDVEPLTARLKDKRQNSPGGNRSFNRDNSFVAAKRRFLYSSSDDDFEKIAVHQPRVGRIPEKAKTAQMRRSHSEKPKRGRNCTGEGPFLPPPSPSLPSSSSSYLGLESSSASATEENRQKEATLSFRNKQALFKSRLMERKQQRMGAILLATDSFIDGSVIYSFTMDDIHMVK